MEIKYFNVVPELLFAFSMDENNKIIEQIPFENLYSYLQVFASNNNFDVSNSDNWYCDINNWNYNGKQYVSMELGQNGD